MLRIFSQDFGAECGVQIEPEFVLDVDLVEHVEPKVDWRSFQVVATVLIVSR